MLRHSPSLESLELNVGDRCRTLLPGYDTTTTTPLLLSSPTTVLASETHVSHSTLSHGRSGGDDLLPTNMSLNSLKLVGRWLLSRASLEQIVTMCPNVETLSLMVTDGIAPEDILRMYQQHGHRLPRLKLVELPQELPEELQHTFGVIGIEDSPDFQEPLVEFMFYDELYGFSA
ncbi:hypothetical protein DFQ27_000551 [Actinomortierella ambigua]|uniref:Uncharacterized protein n=1 Tax=Actinomortierella ambigua TaxID=1343610 RepID=A0A9P6QGP3_9FUNG|nr:hypothetical protein DFQ27_000551 [Actinomortierella ambigua]